jgi:hypothetical protein
MHNIKSDAIAAVPHYSRELLRKKIHPNSTHQIEREAILKQIEAIKAEEIKENNEKEQKRVNRKRKLREEHQSSVERTMKRIKGRKKKKRISR